MGIPTTVTALLPLPLLPEENWRRTDPSVFFLPDGEVLTAAGKPYSENGGNGFFWKVHRQDLSTQALSEYLQSTLFYLKNLCGDEFFEQINANVHRLVVVEVLHGSVRAHLNRDMQLEKNVQIDLVSLATPVVPSVENSGLASALAQRLQCVCPHELRVTIEGGSVGVGAASQTPPLLLCIHQHQPAFSQTAQRLRIQLGAQQKAEVINVECGGLWAHHRTTLQLQDNATCSQLWVFPYQDDSARNCYFERCVELGAGSQFYDGQVIFPTECARVVSSICFQGEQAMSASGAAVVATQASGLDYEPIQNHGFSPRGRSDLLCKMFLTQRAKAVFQGLVTIGREAVGCSAFQLNKNLIHGKKARVDSIPRLEISPQDVSCKHGSATAEIEDAQLYYLTTRGFSINEARQMITQGFLLEALRAVTESSQTLGACGESVLFTLLQRGLPSL